MATVNIPSSVDDPNYRYKMPSVRCKVEGSGNGIKTNLMNMRDVSLALKRNPEYVTKFLACELCVHGRYFSDEGKAIFQGVHTPEALAAKIDAFITSYVLCPNCHLPELDLFVDKKLVNGKCNACGTSSTVNNIHRVAAFIVKNPPEGSTVGKKPSKDEKRATRAAKVTDTPEDETKKRTKKVVKKKVVKKKKKSGDDSDAFDLKSLTANTVMVRMRDYFLDKASTPQTFFQELRTVQLTQSFNTADRFYLALGALFGAGVTVDEGSEFDGTFNKVSISEYAVVLPYLSALAFDSPKDSIAALQKFMNDHVTEESYKSHYPLILKSFYDESIVDDDDVTDFYSAEDGSADYVRAKATLAPLLKWLATAANDSDDSYEDSSDEEDEPLTKKLAL